MHRQTLRIIDVNINRTCEGLRVLEDISRFLLEDRNSSRQLKIIRHSLRDIGGKLGLKLERSRDVDGDIGSDFDLSDRHDDLYSLVKANSRRIEEGLRVLEEISKLPEFIGLLSSEVFHSHRYSVYRLAKNIIMNVSSLKYLSRVHGLYVVITPTPDNKNEIIRFSELAINAGAKIIGLRSNYKKRSFKIEPDTLYKLLELCDRKGVLFILHDQIETALRIKPHGICIEKCLNNASWLQDVLPDHTIIGKVVKSDSQYISAERQCYNFFIIDFDLSKKKIEPLSENTGIFRKIFMLHDCTIAEVDSLIRNGAECFAIEIPDYLSEENIHKIQILSNQIEKKKRHNKQSGQHI